MWEELKNIREGQGLSQFALASKCTMSAAAVSDWENKRPKQIEHLLELCEALGVSPNCLLGWQENEIDTRETAKDGTTIIKSNLTREDLQFFLSTLKARDEALRKKISQGEIDVDIVDLINMGVKAMAKISAALGV